MKIIIAPAVTGKATEQLSHPSEQETEINVRSSEARWVGGY